jgi:serine/threonine protein kinase
LRLLPNNSKDYKKEVDNEIRLLSKISHPNIVKLFNHYSTPIYQYEILELLDGGCLRYWRRDPKVNMYQLYTEYESRGNLQHFSHQYPRNNATNALCNFLSPRLPNHSQVRQNFLCFFNIKRDIKCENILFVRNKPLQVKLIDFGLAKAVGADGKVSKQEFCGTPRYLAPEIINQTGYSYKVDIWSLGVVCFALLFGYLPFDDDLELRLLIKVRDGEWSFPDEDIGISEEAKDLVTKMLERDPEERILVKEAKSHPWFSVDL